MTPYFSPLKVIFKSVISIGFKVTISGRDWSTGWGGNQVFIGTKVFNAFSLEN